MVRWEINSFPAFVPTKSGDIGLVIHLHSSKFFLGFPDLPMIFPLLFEQTLGVLQFPNLCRGSSFTKRWRAQEAPVLPGIGAPPPPGGH